MKRKGAINMDHYYSAKPTSESDRQIIKTAIGGYELELITDSGVFSKHKVDTGSAVLIEASQKSEFPTGKILDLGCGYGTIGLTIAKTFPTREIEMVDVNERALELSKDNAKLNHINNVKIYSSNIYSNVEHTDFAAILSNPPIRAGKKVVHQILADAYDHLKIGGKLQIVIQKKQGAPSAKKKMEEVFGNVERISLEKGYWVLESKRE